MDTLIEVRELYGKARKYIEEEWKNDPETEPYRSKYKAMSYLKEIKEKLTAAIERNDENRQSHLQGMLAVTNLQMGIISLETEEISTGETYLEEAVSLADTGTIPSSKFVLVSLTACTQFGILWCQRSEYEKAKRFFMECENLYTAYMRQDNTECAWSLHEHFESSKEAIGSKGIDDVEKVHTLTKFYLAQIYGKLGDSMKSAIYCHETLRRQLECKEYDAVDWALNSATLSQFFMERKLYKQARHHLAAASYMLDQHEDVLKTLELTEDETEAKREELLHRGADVSRCWAKFGIFILEQSKDINSPSDAVQELEDCWFTSLELSEYEVQMADEPVTDFESARDIMLVTQKYLTSAKQYYSLEDHASDYVQIIQDHSSLIRHLSWFEKDESRLCKMLKKRINMLDDVMKELNPQYYLHLCRALWFELGETYHDLTHIKQTRIRDTEGMPNPSALAKANQLAEQSIRHFRLFIDSVKNKENKLPDPLAEDLLRPTLVAHFFLGRLYYKLVTPDKRQALSNTSVAFNCFKYVVEYCKAHPSSMTVVSDEAQVSEDMMNLLDLKMKQTVTILG